MGAGKTEVGRVLARILGRKFRDTDAMIQRSTGKTISEIFNDEGEGAFRILEAQAVKQAVETEGAVVACGGGVVLDPSNVKVLRSSGLVVYLRPSVSTAAARVGSGQTRPLLAGGDPHESLRALIERRDLLYRSAADHVIDADGPLEQVARAVLAATGKRGGLAGLDEPLHIGPS